MIRMNKTRVHESQHKTANRIYTRESENAAKNGKKHENRWKTPPKTGRKRKHSTSLDHAREIDDADAGRFSIDRSSISTNGIRRRKQHHARIAQQRGARVRPRRGRARYFRAIARFFRLALLLLFIALFTRRMGMRRRPIGAECHVIGRRNKGHTDRAHRRRHDGLGERRETQTRSRVLGGRVGHGARAGDANRRVIDVQRCGRR
jgi:hypothetical protein